MKTRSAFLKQSSKKGPLLGLSRLRRSLIYQPLAAFMAVLLAPAVSYFESTAGVRLGQGASAFQASAQIIGGCGGNGNNIIQQNVCLNGIDYHADLDQLESDAVTAYLTVHNLPAADAHLIYDAGRTDLRNAIRGLMMTILETIIVKDVSQRTPHEQNLYNWLQALVRQNEITEYTQALTNFSSFRNDPCHYTLDPDLAQQYGISFDPTLWCFPLLARGFSPPIPDANYFIAYGMKQSYEKPAGTYANFPPLVAGMAISEHEALNDFVQVASILSTGAAVPIIAVLVQFSWIAVLYTGTIIPLESISALTAVVGTLTGGSAVYLFGGPLGAILASILSGALAGMQIYTDEAALNTLSNLNNTLTQVTNAPPDLAGFMKDSVGLLKLRMTLAAQTLPDTPSTAPLPAHRTDADLAFQINNTLSDTLSYKDWGGASWSAKTYGGWFVQTCNSAINLCGQTDSLAASINYLDWSGVKWAAARFGNHFIVSKAVPASTDKPCTADQITGLSPLPSSGDFSACSSYVSSNIQIMDPSGNQLNVSLAAPPLPPAFTSSTTLSFTPGQAATRTITASGVSTPALSLASGSSNPLPSDFSLSCGSGSCQLAFNGDSNAPAQTYQLSLQAAIPGASVTQTFSIIVNLNLAITSPATFTGTAGVPVNFTVTTTGTPVPHLALTNMSLQPGLTFTDNGDGTATISGTANNPASTFCTGTIITGDSGPTTQPCGITAGNSLGSTLQSTTIVLNPAPAPALTADNRATFIAGIPNSVVVTTSGAITPVSFLYSQPAVAGWLSFHDNGDGTAVLSGTPPAGTTGVYSIPLTPVSVGEGVALGQSSSYTLTVVDTPVFISPGSAAFTVGTYGSFEVQTNGNAATTAFTLPKGLTFNTGNPASITGTPAGGTGGVYSFPILDDAGSAGSATQQFTLSVYEAPAITSSNSATLFTGVPGYFAVTTTGYPSLSTQPVSDNSLPPMSPADGKGMYFTVTGLPADLQYTNLNPQGFATGMLTIQGTPSAADAGTHQVTITAANGVGVPVQQTLTLNIIKITGAAPASATSCNGNYNGTFRGNLTISPGQNCSFVDGGGVAGNVSVNGGNFAVAGGTIAGNVLIQGTAAFSIGPFSTIGGNLSIQNVASASTASQVCGSKIGGTLQVYSNATPAQIGSAAQDSCPGNFVGKNVAIQNNTAAIGVYNNAVVGNLSCSSNTSIAGSGNAAQKQSGQCSAF